MHASPFGLWLRDERTKRKLSQARLAQLTGMHRLQVCYLETGRTALPRLAARQRIYEVLGALPPPHVVIASKRRGSGDACSFCEQAITDGDVCFRSTTHKTICRRCVQLANQVIAQSLRANRFQPELEKRPEIAHKSVATKERTVNRQRKRSMRRPSRFRLL